MSDKRFPDVPGGYPFPQLELKVLEQWKQRGIFEKSLQKPSPEGEFVFFEGPPTANNVPHVGHVVTRVVKDLFPRYRTMRGYHVRAQGRAGTPTASPSRSRSRSASASPASSRSRPTASPSSTRPAWTASTPTSGSGGR